MESGADSTAKAAKGPPSPPSQGASAARRLWRFSNLIMAVFFGLAGAVQVAYSVPAALTLVVSINPSIADNIVWRSLSDLHSAACVMGSAILGYSLFANSQKNILHEEEGRELFGLVIVTVWMSLCRSSAKTLGGIRLAIAIFLSVFPFVMWLYIYVNAEMRASWPSHCKTVI
ncbi:transmembrane protein 220 isoform X2 [Hemicordylus capensis]|uniref:transmembrane protein 220 isoform X2 n=1 Tax=Hemicordylus capensis TaxID=884348 RepID=UPI002303DCAB|nr:transmembrane protein 220 isoform X2 [Hemicordylus capensis]